MKTDIVHGRVSDNIVLSGRIFDPDRQMDGSLLRNQVGSALFLIECPYNAFLTVLNSALTGKNVEEVFKEAILLYAFQARLHGIQVAQKIQSIVMSHTGAM
jgi:hypothetical protein